jgi:ATP-binding protein involved in chromosome partitioning
VVVGDPLDPAARAIDAVADALVAQGRGLAGRPLPFTPR